MNLPEYLNKMKELQKKLLVFIEDDDNIEENFHDLQNYFHEINILNNLHDIKVLLHLLAKISSDHYRGPIFFNKIEGILHFCKTEIKNYYSNLDIFKVFFNNKRILLYLINDQIIDLNDEVIGTLLSLDCKTCKYPQYFSPEIRSYIQKKSSSNKENILEEILKEISPDFEKKRSKGENDEYICQLIQNDSIDEFINYVKESKYLPNSVICPSIYETNNFLLKNKDISLIEYAAFYGSIQIFKYLRLNKAKLTSSLLLFAIHGNNKELIQFILENHIKLSDNFIQKCFKEAIKCHHNSIANYNKDNLFTKPEKNDFLKIYLKNYNFLFIQEGKINPKSFFYLCKFDHYRFIEILLKNANIDINKRFKTNKNEQNNFQLFCEYKETPLNVSVINGCTEIVKLLLKQNKINVNLPTKIKRAEFEWGKWSECKEWLIKEEITALIYAIEQENLELIDLLLNHDDIDVNFQVEKSRYIGDTDFYEYNKGDDYHDGGIGEYTRKNALITAIQKGNSEIVQLLLKNKGIDTNMPLVYIDYSGCGLLNDYYKRNVKQPLNIAISQENEKIIKLLLSHENINPNIDSIKYVNISSNAYERKDEIVSKGKSPLNIAIKKENINIIKILLDNEKVNINHLDFSDINRINEQKNALFYAIEKENEEIINILLKNSNIDINLSCHIGDDEKPVIFYAIENQNENLVKLFLEHENIDLKIKYKYKKEQLSAITYAVLTGNENILNLLLKHESSFNPESVSLNTSSDSEYSITLSESSDDSESEKEIEALTILVESVEENLSTIPIEPLSKEHLEKIYGIFYSTSMKEGQKINFEFGTQPVLQGFINAYKNHRPITISPDIIWLLIIQAFAHHISANIEELRPMFVNFDGQKELTVERPDLDFFTMQSEDYQREVFPDFVKQISSYTGKEIVDLMTPDFTTTTAVSLAVGQLSIMSAMKNFFTYKLIVGGCGFPYITIEGTIEDWIKINTKLDNLKKYKFEWFTEKITKVIDKIIDTKNGNVDKSFWKRMIKIKDRSGTYSPDLLNGWFINFFPYDFYDKKIKGPISETTVMPNEMLSVPFLLKIVMPGEDVDDSEPIECEMLAGFVGLTQNKENASIKPEIGWLIRPKRKISIKNQRDYERIEVKKNSIHFS